MGSSCRGLGVKITTSGVQIQNTFHWQEINPQTPRSHLNHLFSSIWTQAMMLWCLETYHLLMSWCAHGLMFLRTGGKNHNFSPNSKDFLLRQEINPQTPRSHLNHSFSSIWTQAMMLWCLETYHVLPWCTHGLILSWTESKNHNFSSKSKDFSLARNQPTDP